MYVISKSIHTYLRSWRVPHLQTWVLTETHFYEFLFTDIPRLLDDAHLYAYSQRYAFKVTQTCKIIGFSIRVRIFDYLLRHSRKCLICLFVPDWYNGVLARVRDLHLSTSTQVKFCENHNGSIDFSEINSHANKELSNQTEMEGISPAKLRFHLYIWSISPSK